MIRDASVGKGLLRADEMFAARIARAAMAVFAKSGFADFTSGTIRSFGGNNFDGNGPNNGSVTPISKP